MRSAFLSFLLLASVLRAEDAVPSEEACAKLAKSIESSMATGDVSVFEAALDLNAMLDQALSSIDDFDLVKKGFRTGVLQAGSMPRNVAEAIKDSGSYKLLRLHTVQGKPRALFRMLSSDGGLNYHDMVLATGPGGSVRIADLHDSLLGENFVRTLRRGFLTAVAISDAPKDRLAGWEAEFAANIGKMQEIQKLAAQGKRKEAIRIFDGLPESMRKDRNVLMIRYSIASVMNDEAEYKRAIEDLVAAFPDDSSLNLVLVDAHFFRKDFAKALKTIDSLDAGIGGDPYLHAMRANVHYADGKLEEAKKAARKSIMKEPTLANPHWVLVQVSLNEKKFGETVESLNLIEKNLGLVFGDLAEIPEYAEFAKSEEYKKWMESR